jgi:hypothetical protein
MSNSAITGPILVDTSRAPSGTAAAPSFAFSDSMGTGAYLVSAGVLGLSTNGVQRVVVDASGNVGIGTGSPARKLHVDASGSVYATIRNSANNVNTTIGATTTDGWVGTESNHPLVMYTNATERMRIDASGNLLVGITSGSSNQIQHPNQTQGNTNLFLNNCSYFFVSAGLYGNIAATAMRMNSNTVTGRSINAGGTINASGADYAEYMTKAGEFTIAKGDICGVDAEGKLTNVFSEAVAFVVKSTNPSYVGGDSWGAGFEDDAEGLEAARQLVDRIAFCGQVPVNVLGATPGQWIIPVEENGAIKGQAISNPSFEQYQLAVGKVVAVEEDGRARIIVKIA